HSNQHLSYPYHDNIHHHHNSIITDTANPIYFPKHPATILHKSLSKSTALHATTKPTTLHTTTTPTTAISFPSDFLLPILPATTTIPIPIPIYSTTKQLPSTP